MAVKADGTQLVISHLFWT